MKSTLLIRSILVGVFVVASVAVPSFALASYTMHGHEFETLDELTEYMEEYQRVYKEIHGGASTIPGTSFPSTATQITRAQKPAIVQTVGVRTVDMYKARLAGSVTTTNTKAVRVWFEYGQYGLTERTADEVLYKDRSVRTFDRELRNLNHNTTYYYRAVAVNDSGSISYGKTYTFKTAVDPRKDTAAVRITTGGAKDVDDNHATLNAKINFRKASYARVWFEYGDEADDLYKKTPQVVITPKIGKTYARTITGLDDSTQYYFRTVAEDPSGARSYGKVKKFKTKKDISDEKPKLIMQRATDITRYEARVAGSVDMNDFNNGIVFLVYGEDRDAVTSIAKDYTRVSRIREDGDDLQIVVLDKDLDRFDSFKEQLLFLDLGTTYYVALGVEYENDEGDDVLLMSKTISFKTTEK